MLTRILRRTVQMVAIVGLCLTGANHAQAQSPVTTGWGLITQLGGGWSANQVSVFHSAPILNPGGCPLAKNGYYSTDPTDPGANLYHTMILSAFMNKREIVFVIAGCNASVPKIIGLLIR